MPVQDADREPVTPEHHSSLSSVNDFLPAIVSLVVLAAAFLLAWFFDLCRMHRIRSPRRMPATRPSPVAWPNKATALAFRQGRRRN
jgi:hypothetical protein